MTVSGAEKSQQCHKYFPQYSTFASERPQVRTLGRQTCFLPRGHLTSLRPCYSTRATKYFKRIYRINCVKLCLENVQIFVVCRSVEEVENLHYCILPLTSKDVDMLGTRYVYWNNFSSED